MKVAALDLGSNTFLCLIAEVEKNQIKKIYQDEVQVVRLGQALNQNKNFHPDALLRAEKCLEKFSEIIKQEKPDRILAMATSAARDAENSQQLFDIANKYNIPLEIIPGNKEAEITYSGAVSGQLDQEEQRLVIDIGGGSTEFIFGTGHTKVIGQSFDIGCVRLTEKFIAHQPTSDYEIKNAIQFIDEVIQQAKLLKPNKFNLEKVIAVAGTPTTLAAAMIGGFFPEKIDGFKLKDIDLIFWLKKLQDTSVSEKIALGIPEGRADVLLIGVLILLRTMQIFNLNEIEVSTRGVRHGVALEVASR